MTERCPTCGAAVRIEASGTTHYMVPTDAERVRKLEWRLSLRESAWAAAEGLDRQKSERISELTALVESAYREGFCYGCRGLVGQKHATRGWNHSESKKALEQRYRVAKAHARPLIELATNASGLAMLLKEKFEGMKARELREHTARGAASAAHSLSGAVETSADSLSRKLISQRDIAIIDAVSDKLGCDDWTAREIRDRLIFQVQEGVTTAILDGEPLLKIYPPELEAKEVGSSTHLTAKQRIWRQNETDQE